MVYDHPPYLNAHFYNNMIFYEDQLQRYCLK